MRQGLAGKTHALAHQELVGWHAQTQGHLPPQERIAQAVFARKPREPPRSPWIAWFQDPRYAFYALAFTSLIAFGGMMVVFLAGLKNIPETLYEAAVIDGAGKTRRFLSITLPMLSPVLFFALVMGTINAFQHFTAAFVISKGTGGPLSTTVFYMINLYRNAFQYSKAGYASSMAWVLFWIIILVTLLIFRSSNLWVFYETEVRTRKAPKEKRS